MSLICPTGPLLTNSTGTQDNASFSWHSCRWDQTETKQRLMTTCWGCHWLCSCYCISKTRSSFSGLIIMNPSAEPVLIFLVPYARCCCQKSGLTRGKYRLHARRLSKWRRLERQARVAGHKGAGILVACLVVVAVVGGIHHWAQAGNGVGARGRGGRWG